MQQCAVKGAAFAPDEQDAEQPLVFAHICKEGFQRVEKALVVHVHRQEISSWKFREDLLLHLVQQCGRIHIVGIKRRAVDIRAPAHIGHADFFERLFVEQFQEGFFEQPFCHLYTPVFQRGASCS